MGKYLIQDIVPANKKYRTVKAPTVSHESRSAHHPKSVHHDEKSSAGEHAHHRQKHDSPISKYGDDIVHVDQQNSGVDHNELHAVDEAMSTPSKDIPPTETAAPATPSSSWKPDAMTETSRQQFFGDGVPPSINTTPHFEADDENRYASWLPWTLGSLITLTVLGFVLNFFSGATILLIPKKDSMPIEQKLTALKNPLADELPFAVMKVEETLSSEVLATGTKTVTTKASGRIIVYNEQLSPQRLIKNTRFESPTGKIYRINESITVPKKTGTKIGTLEVTVYADEAGAAYNTEPTDFTVPGLKNTPQATKVYGRGKGPITGGASGTIKTVADQDLKQAQNDLRVALETKLRSRARGNLSPSQITFDQGIVVDLGDPKLSNDKATSEERAVVTGSGTIYMVVFDRKELTKAVAKASVPTYAGEEIALDNLNSLTLRMATTTGHALWSIETLEFTISGTPSLRWVIDEDAIKNELLGLPKADFNAKMTKYGTVERAKASLRPFWKQRFPADSKKITIKIVDEIKD